MGAAVGTVGAAPFLPLVQEHSLLTYPPSKEQWPSHLLFFAVWTEAPVLLGRTGAYRLDAAGSPPAELGGCQRWLAATAEGHEARGA